MCDDEQIAAAYTQEELNELWRLRDALPPPGADLLAQPEARFPSVSGLGADAVAFICRVRVRVRGEG